MGGDDSRPADERDTLFARMQLKEGSERHREYYARHPEQKGQDDALRQAPGKARLVNFAPNRSHTEGPEGALIVGALCRANAAIMTAHVR